MHDRLATLDSDLICNSGEQKSKKALKQKPTFVRKTIKAPNNKATFNLSKKILHRLEDCWKETRCLTESKQISRTLLVEKALEVALEDFNKKKQASWFYHHLVSNKKIKQ